MIDFVFRTYPLFLRECIKSPYFVDYEIIGDVVQLTFDFPPTKQYICVPLDVWNEYAKMA